MELFNNQYCITHSELATIMSKDQLYRLSVKNDSVCVRRGCYGTPALYSVDSLPEKFKIEVYQKLGDPRKSDETSPIMELLKNDDAAVKFFAEYEYPATGEKMNPKWQREYVNNAVVLNAMRERLQQMDDLHRKHGDKLISRGVFFEKAAEKLPIIAQKYAHRLPENPRKLQQKYLRYLREGYASLVKQTGVGMKNALVVTPILEKMFLSIYAMKNKPFCKSVREIYDMFLNGEVEIVDRETGELFQISQFADKRGELIRISDGTVWNWLNKPKNRRLVDALRNDSLYNKKTHTPYQIRKSPDWSLSKISMDDRDLPRKTPDGRTVKAYYAYDVASGCVIGTAYSYDKDIELVRECFRNMFGFLLSNNLGMPLEVEVEHHLMNKIEDDLNAMFPYVRFCAPGNSREKRAEHFNRAKKYSAEKALRQTNGRWWAHGEAYLERSEREGAEYKEVRLSYDKLVAEDLEAIETYNNMPHPDISKNPDMRRIDVLLNKQNPNLPTIDMANICRHVGFATKTTLRNSKYVRVQYNDYQLPTPNVIDRFKPNNYECTAYWLPDGEGNIVSVYLFQDDKFIAECAKTIRYNESAAERCEADNNALTEQCKYDAQYRKMQREGKEKKIAKVEIIKAKTIRHAIETPVEVAPAPAKKEQQFDDDYNFDNYGELGKNKL